MLTNDSQQVAAGFEIPDIPIDAFETSSTSLDEFALEPGCSRGVFLDSLDEGARVVVGTAHSCYRFIVTNPARRLATVVGGKVFLEPVEARVEGATLGGSVIKSGWIGMGLRLELAVGSKRITTSPVKFLAIE